MDRKKVAKQLREEAAQLLSAADMLDGGRRPGRPRKTADAPTPAKKRRASKKAAPAQ